MSCGSDDEPVGGVGVEISWQAHAAYRYGWLNWQQIDALDAKGRVYPRANVQR